VICPLQLGTTSEELIPTAKHTTESLRGDMIAGRDTPL